MLKKILPAAVLILTFNISFAQNTTNEPHAIYRNKSYNKTNFISDRMINPIFTNVNLTNQPFPQNEPSVRISRTDPNYVVAAWRDFGLGYNPAIRRIGYTYSTDGGFTWLLLSCCPTRCPAMRLRATLS
ncbi:MAG: hypothetical protein NTY74_09900 [Ignavibacteriae bacterium]|nr:hypothetical protein [Ignavibacteriota bacterium]